MAELTHPRLLAAKQETITAEVEAIMNRVAFCDTPDELLAKSREPLQNTSRGFVLVECQKGPTGDFSQLHIAEQVSRAYLDGNGSAADGESVSDRGSGW